MSIKILSMENLFMALADKTRLRLLSLMNKGEICVCYFTEVLQEGQPKISRHLAYLRRAGLVETRRDGKWIYYRLATWKNENARRILEEVKNWSETDGQTQRDRERFVQICCRPEEMPVAIQRAPSKPKMPVINASDESRLYQKEPLAEFLL